MNRRVGAIVLVVLLCFSVVGPTAGVFGTAVAGATQPESNAFQQDQIDADEVRMDVAIQSNGTAEWTLEFWIRLDDDESEAAFESLRQDIRDNPDNYTQSFADRMTETAATASESTGREMAVDGFDVETQRQSLAREYGVVRYTFDWHGFAAVEDGEIRVGDAIEGIYLDEGTRLLVEWPEGYERTAVAPDPDDERDRAVIWRGGETDFVSGEPRVVLAAGGGPSTTTVVAAALAVVALAAGGAWWYRNRDQPAGQDGGSGDTVTHSGVQAASRVDETGADLDDSGDEPGTRDGPASEPPADRSTSPPDQSASSADQPPSSAEQSASPIAGTPDVELLSNEEQVIRLLESRGGRMKQQSVVEELDWTDAKTSKVVTGLREEGKLESFRLGRENVLSLPEVEGPGGADSGSDGSPTAGGDGDDGGDGGAGDDGGDGRP
ncbi:DUF7345 domain-containing protein [Natronosalvus halobius]|uniref:DUF7345 domain-containing protein n=1 Tax=Natronosalvus halobius TaxID=2953746 RepID=UPI00209F7D30|nr:hypothetical protein [Natronosalvus halobius]USZ70956.1 hypothetical protein NGM15_12760 [Natronosalvus halobius]